ncbi:hypothetical protein ACIBSV_18215 [Embleya sp. NPDC050154]
MHSSAENVVPGRSGPVAGAVRVESLDFKNVADLGTWVAPLP